MYWNHHGGETRKILKSKRESVAAWLKRLRTEKDVCMGIGGKGEGVAWEKRATGLLRKRQGGGAVSYPAVLPLPPYPGFGFLPAEPRSFPDAQCWMLTQTSKLCACFSVCSALSLCPPGRLAPSLLGLAARPLSLISTLSMSNHPWKVEIALLSIRNMHHNMPCFARIIGLHLFLLIDSKLLGELSNKSLYPQYMAQFLTQARSQKIFTEQLRT